MRFSNFAIFAAASAAYVSAAPAAEAKDYDNYGKYGGTEASISIMLWGIDRLPSLRPVQQLPSAFNNQLDSYAYAYANW